MRRIHPRRIQDKFYLSQLLEQLLCTLETCPLQVHLRALSYDSRIPESIFRRLRRLHLNPADAVNIQAEDFHILFSNILFRYPTVKMYEQADGSILFIL